MISFIEVLKNDKIIVLDKRSVVARSSELFSTRDFLLVTVLYLDCGSTN